MSRPAYLNLLENGELQRRAEEAQAHLQACDLCPWECRSDRIHAAGSVCHTGFQAEVSGFGAHHGEEAPLRGWGGSGTIFFSRCNLRCQFCQNHEISQEAGEATAAEALAQIMLKLQDIGCHNINLVSPTHVIAQILAALVIAARGGLRLPLVYNTGGFDSPVGLALLDGVIDIYMPDMKYASEIAARQYSKARRYPEVNRAAVREMHRQVGDLQIGADGLAQRGLLVRHLVLPNGVSEAVEILRFLAQEISVHTYVNIMDQYRPEYNVRRYPNQFPKLRRIISVEEYAAAVSAARSAGLYRLDD